MLDAMPALNPAQIEDLRNLDGGRGAVLARLVEKFAAVVGARVASIQALASASRTEELSAEAHSLKGAAGNLGAARFAKLCHEIELAGRSGNVALAASLVTRLQDEGERSLAALLQEIGRGV